MTYTYLTHGHWANVRAKYYTVTSLSELFLKVVQLLIIDFNKENDFYRKTSFCFYVNFHSHFYHRSPTIC